MYLLACSVVMLVAIYQWWRAFVAASDIDTYNKNIQSPIWLCLIPALFMLTPFIVSALDELHFHGGHSIPISSGIGSVAASLFGALVVLAATVVDGIRHRSERGYGISGKRLVLAASASLVLVATTSHLMFARDAGTVTFELFRDEVNDMHCDSGLVLFRWDRSPDSPVQYRCPRGYLLNRHSSFPFLPWPDYSEVYSADLAVALHEIMSQIPEQ